jgi:hypothetical protein
MSHLSTFGAWVQAHAGMGNTLLVGGSFTSMSDAPAASVATLDTATGTWNTPGGMRWRNGPARVTAAAITSTGNAHVISAGA